MRYKSSILCLVVIVGFFLMGCEKQEIPPQKTYVIANMPPKVIEVADEDQDTWMESSSEHRQELNKMRNLRELNESDEEFEQRSKLKNVHRTVDGEEIIGYDPELDNPDLKEVDD